MPKVRIPVPGPVLGLYPERKHTPAHTAFVAILESWCDGLAVITHWRQRKLLKHVERIKQHQAQLPEVPGLALRQALNQARAEMSRDGLTSDAALRCMAGVLICARAVTGLTLRDNQIMAALCVLRGNLAEMPTGEGKTLSTALAAATAALAGIPVHVITANDYLAMRDAEQVRPIYRLLGLSVSAIQQKFKHSEHIEAYACNLTYCSAKELVFDYLRDGMAPLPRPGDDELGLRRPARVLRGLCMAIIDEADSVLIDEAQTPFILSEIAAEPDQVRLCKLAIDLCQKLTEGVHYVIASNAQHAELTDSGRVALGEHIDEIDSALWCIPSYREEMITMALSALYVFQRDVHYIVRDNKVHIVDANTGRVAEGRAWSRGLHQMVEIKEGCPPTPATRILSQITFQRFFPRYHCTGGMSGTLTEARRELLEVYGLSVLRIPSHKPSRLQISAPQVFASARERWLNVLDAIIAQHAQKRPVLIGTDSVRDSERLSQLLAAEGLPHRVLNARQDREEAELIAHAGKAGAITVATNMAGRGTDIHIPPDVAQSGGLHVISCQHNSARRVDRQLYGRAGRQGQAGSAETILSLEEGLLGRTLSPAVRRLIGLTIRSDGRLPLIIAKPLFRFAQWHEEDRARAARKSMRTQDAAIQKKMHFGLPAE